MRLKSILSTVIILLSVLSVSADRPIHIVSSDKNDLYSLLTTEGFALTRHDNVDQAIDIAGKGDAVVITAAAYPDSSVKLSESQIRSIKDKKLRLYAEYVSEFPGLTISSEPFVASLERGVISSRFFDPQLKPMDIIGLNGCHLYEADASKPLISFAKVAGFDKATYGLKDTDVYPLLWKDGDCMIAFSCLSNFRTARYAPVEAWKNVWIHIISWLVRDNNVELASWESDVRPAYAPADTLPADAALQAIRKGTEWLYGGRFVVHPSWLDDVLKNQGDGLMPVGLPVSQDKLPGNGSLGVLEGHTSSINHLGDESYRYWMRADVQGETAFLLA